MKNFIKRILIDIGVILVAVPLLVAGATAVGWNTTNNLWISPNPVNGVNQIIFANNGFFSVASSTQSGPFYLSALSQGTANIGSSGRVYSTSTSTPTVTAPITYSGTFGSFIGGSSGTFDCTSASAGVKGCITAADYSKFNSASTTFSSPLVYTNTTNAVNCPTCVVTSRQITVAGTANQITSSAGAQDLSADRTWTLSFPNQVIFPQYASTTLGFSTPYASSTNLFAGIFTLSTSTAGCAALTSGGVLYSTGVACGTGSGSSSFGFPFTMTTFWQQTMAGTSTALRLTGSPISLSASSTAMFENASTSLLTVSRQGSTVQPAVSNSTVHIVGNDGSPLRLTLVTNNNANTSGTAIMGVTSGGTAATPAATLANQQIISLNGRGYGSATMAAGSTGVIAIKNDSASAFTDTSMPTAVTIDTTPTNSVTGVERVRINRNGNFGVATTDPQWKISVASTTMPQLALLGNDTDNIWTARSIGGSFYLATASPSTYATSSVSAFSLNINGFPVFPSLTGVGCIQANASGQLTNTGSACGSAAGLASYDAFTHPAAGQSATTSLMLLFGNASTTGLSANYAFIGQTATTTITPAGFVGIGTSTPYGNLSIHAPSQTNPYFVIGSSTSQVFSISPSSTGGTLTLSSTTAGCLQINNVGLVFAQTCAGGGSVTSISEGVGFLNRGTAITTTGTLTVGIATSTTPTISGIPMWTGAGDGTNPATLGSISTSTLVNNIFPFTNYGASTSTVFGFTGGLFSTASSTFNSNLYLPSIGQGILYTGSNGLVKSTATSSFSLSQFTNDLATLTATDASLTFSGSYNGATARTVGLNVGNSNTFTAKQNFFANASSTGESANYAYFGSSGTTTIDTVGRLSGAYSSSTAYASFVTASTTFLRIGLADGCLNITSGLVGTTGVACGSASGLASYDAWSHLIFGGINVPSYSATTSQLSISTSTTASNISALTVSSSTASQIALSSGAGFAQWVLRNAGGEFSLSTTTVAGTATTSIPAFIVSGSGFGTTTLRGLSILGQATSTSNVGFNLTSGCYAINNVCLSTSGGSGLSSYDAWTHLVFGGVNSPGYSATTSMMAIGTSTAPLNMAALTIASSTVSQLALSAGAGVSMWTMRNAGGSFYISTTTTAGTATSSTAALTIGPATAATPGTALGIGTTSPWRSLSVVGTIAVNGLTSATGKNSVCIDAVTKELVDAGSNTCNLSSKYLKDITGNVTPELAQFIVERMQAITFNYKGDTEEHYGFIAEQVAQIDKEVALKFGVYAHLATYAQEEFTNKQTGHVFKKGDPSGVDYQMYTAVLTVYLQNQTGNTTKTNDLYLVGLLGAFIWLTLLTLKKKNE